MLIIFAGIASFLSVFILNIAGLPGALLAGTPGKRPRAQFISGSIASALGQSYVYLAFNAFVVNWTMLAASRDEVVGFLLWPFAFLAVMAPVWISLIRARTEDREHESANAQVEALHITVIAAFLGFFVFALVPSFMTLAWGWVPYVR